MHTHTQGCSSLQLGRMHPVGRVRVSPPRGDLQKSKGRMQVVPSACSDHFPPAFQGLEEYVFEFIQPRLQVSHNNMKGWRRFTLPVDSLLYQVWHLGHVSGHSSCMLPYHSADLQRSGFINAEAADQQWLPTIHLLNSVPRVIPPWLVPSASVAALILPSPGDFGI